MKKKNANNKGFSLVELIVVIAIMAVLVGVLGPQFMKYVEKGRQSTDIQTVDNIATALKTYYTDHEPSATPLSLSISKGTAVTTDPAVTNAGLGASKLKSANWTITITYTKDTGAISYSIAPTTGATVYYQVDPADASQFIAE